MEDKTNSILIPIAIASPGVMMLYMQGSSIPAWLLLLVSALLVVVFYLNGDFSNNESIFLINILPAIESNSDIYNVRGIQKVSKHTPAMGSGLLDHFENKEKLRSHISYLNNINEIASIKIKAAKSHFATGRSSVETQQLALRRLADRAAVVARKVESSFPNFKTGSPRSSHSKSLVLPPAPKLETLANFDQRQKNFTAATARLAVQAGNQGGPLGMVVALAAAAAIGVVAQQKQIRAMEEAHGELRNFVSDARAELELLGLAHAELVNISVDVYTLSKELRDLLTWADEVDKQGKFSSNAYFNADERKKIESIISFALIANIDASRKV